MLLVVHRSDDRIDVTCRRVRVEHSPEVREDVAEAPLAIIVNAINEASDVSMTMTANHYIGSGRDNLSVSNTRDRKTEEEHRTENKLFHFSDD